MAEATGPLRGSTRQVEVRASPPTAGAEEPEPLPAEVAGRGGELQDLFTCASGHLTTQKDGFHRPGDLSRACIGPPRPYPLANVRHNVAQAKPTAILNYCFGHLIGLRYRHLQMFLNDFDVKIQPASSPGDSAGALRASRPAPLAKRCCGKSALHRPLAAGSARTTRRPYDSFGYPAFA